MNANQQQILAIIYEDSSIQYYYNIDSSSEKLAKINPQNKKYICVKIFEDEKYSTVFYGHDYVGLFYSKDDNKIKGEQFDDNNNNDNKFDIVFEGKLLPDDEYEKLRLLCHDLKYNK